MDTSEYRGRRLLATLQLADSFFPTGAYAHSQGLEQMVAQGWVSNSAQVEEYLTEQLTGAVLPSDGVALLNACEAAAGGDGETIIAIDRLLHAMKLPEEVRLAPPKAGGGSWMSPWGCWRQARSPWYLKSTAVRCCNGKSLEAPP